MRFFAGLPLTAILLATSLWAQPAPAEQQTPAPAPAAAEGAAAAPAVAPGVAPVPGTPQDPNIVAGTRILGVMPNYKTVEKMRAYEPLTAKAKFVIATKDSFDYRGLMYAASLAEIDVLTGQNKDWGGGFKGFAKNYGASVADSVISNYLTEGILPAVLHHDPRYFRMGPGHNIAHRVVHAASWIFINKDDNYRTIPNVSEIVGSGLSAAIGWYYYPKGDRFSAPVMDRFVTQVTFDAASAELKEFWPDVRDKFFKKH